MAALNISYELLQASEQDAIINTTPDPENASVNQLNHKIDDALYQLRQLEIR
jgi:cell division protein ZapA